MGRCPILSEDGGRHRRDSERNGKIQEIDRTPVSTFSLTDPTSRFGGMRSFRSVDQLDDSARMVSLGSLASCRRAYGSLSAPKMRRHRLFDRCSP
jgi:hypothetical protein